MFRLHRKQRLDLFGGGAGGSSTLHAAAAAGASITRIDVPLLHNTLVIMWPPCQEAWKHEVGAEGLLVGLKLAMPLCAVCSAGSSTACRVLPTSWLGFHWSLCNTTASTPQPGQIPKTTKPFPLHPKSGAVRFNLTFRRLKPQWVERAPRCACGRIAQMKARQPRELPPEGAPARELSYFHTCEHGERGGRCMAVGQVVRLHSGSQYSC